MVIRQTRKRGGTQCYPSCSLNWGSSGIFRKDENVLIVSTVGGHVQVRKEVVGIGLTEIVAIQVESRETDGGPKHDFPVDLPNQSLQTY